MLTLHETAITRIDSEDPGASRGTTSMSFDGRSWAGMWGNQFFGDDADEASLSAAGTFGAAAGVDTSGIAGGAGHGSVSGMSNAIGAPAFIGAYGAYRTAYKDRPGSLVPQYGWNAEGEWVRLPPGGQEWNWDYNDAGEWVRLGPLP